MSVTNTNPTWQKSNAGDAAKQPNKPQLGPDEMFCTECGEAIKKAAICPECGVSNGAGQAQTTTGHPNPRKTARRQTVTDELFTPDLRQHDPTGYTTTVAGKWHYAVGLSAVLWIGWYLLPAPEILDLTVFIPWALMPLGIYLDRQWVRATTRWDPPVKTVVAGVCTATSQHLCRWSTCSGAGMSTQSHHRLVAQPKGMIPVILWNDSKTSIVGVNRPSTSGCTEDAVFRDVMPRRSTSQTT